MESEYTDFGEMRPFINCRTFKFINNFLAGHRFDSLSEHKLNIKLIMNFDESFYIYSMIKFWSI